MRSHSWMSPQLSVRPSPLGGLGVFADQALAAGEVVLVWGGHVITGAELIDLRRYQPGIDDRCIAVHADFWLAATDAEADDAERINHSCDPNAGVRGQVVLVARRDIRSGEEVTFDYQTAEHALPAFRCRCDSPHCRGTVDGTAWRDAGWRARHEGYLAPHIADLARATSFRPQ